MTPKTRVGLQLSLEKSVSAHNHVHDLPMSSPNPTYQYQKSSPTKSITYKDQHLFRADGLPT